MQRVNRTVLILFLLLIPAGLLAQKTLMVGKSGSTKHYFYRVGDPVKLRVSPEDTLLRGRIWALSDSIISVSELRPFDVHLGDINAVYKRFYFPAKFGRYMLYGSAGLFAIIGINHLLNKEPFISKDMLIISGSLAGAGLISLSFSQKKCRMGKRWNVRILDIEIRSP